MSLVKFLVLLSILLISSCGGSNESSQLSVREEINVIEGQARAPVLGNNLVSLSDSSSVSSQTYSEIALAEARVCLYDALTGNSYTGTDFSTPLCAQTNSSGQFLVDVSHLIEAGISLSFIEIRISKLLDSNDSNSEITLRTLASESNFDSIITVSYESTVQTQTFYTTMESNGFSVENMHERNEHAVIDTSFTDEANQLFEIIQSELTEIKYDSRILSKTGVLTENILGYTDNFTDNFDEGLGSYVNEFYATVPTGNYSFIGDESLGYTVNVPPVHRESTVIFGQATTFDDLPSIPEHVILVENFNMCLMKDPLFVSANISVVDYEMKDCPDQALPSGLSVEFGISTENVSQSIYDEYYPDLNTNLCKFFIDLNYDDISLNSDNCFRDSEIEMLNFEDPSCYEPYLCSNLPLADQNDSSSDMSSSDVSTNYYEENSDSVDNLFDSQNDSSSDVSTNYYEENSDSVDNLFDYQNDSSSDVSSNSLPQVHQCYDQNGNIHQNQLCHGYPMSITSFGHVSLAIIHCREYWDYASSSFDEVPISMTSYCNSKLAHFYQNSSNDPTKQTILECTYGVYAEQHYDSECNVVYKYSSSDREECAESNIGLDDIEIYVDPSYSRLEGSGYIVRDTNYDQCQ